MYRVGVIGLGQIAYNIDKDPNRKIIWSHIKAYQSIEKCEISTICDIKLSTAQVIQKEYNIKNGYIDYNEMLNENKFDIVSICTPIQTHFEIVKKCIETGVKAIFCEKTLSYSLEEAEEMLRLCKENNVIFGINYILRWDILNEYVNSTDKLNILRKSVEELLAEYNEHISKKIKNYKYKIIYSKSFNIHFIIFIIFSNYNYSKHCN